MKLSLALFTAALATTAAADCGCPCGNGLGVWVDHQVQEDCAPKRTCAGHSVARALVEGAKATCVDECPESCADAPEPEEKAFSPSKSAKSPSGSAKSPKEKSGSAKSPKEKSGSAKSPKEKSGSLKAPSGSAKSPKEKSGSLKAPSGSAKSPKEKSGSLKAPSGSAKSPKEKSGSLKAPSGSAKSPKEKTWSRTWDWGKSGDSKSKDSKSGDSKSPKSRTWDWGKSGSKSKDSKDSSKDGKFSFKRRSTDPKDAAPGAQCPNLSKNEDPETKEKLNPYVPKPTFCQLKRATSYLKFEPNFPEGRPDVYIEVIADGEIFQLFPDDYEGEAPGPFYVYEGDSTKEGQLFLGMDSKEFITLYNEQEKMGGTGFQFRFVSKNGPGEWNSCSYSPIAFDLNGNGVVEHITSAEGWEIDITGNGDMEHLAEWFAPDEGILIDAHTEIVDGAVSGAHMMGDMGGKYTDGFAKLATYDTDCDNKISGKELENFRIWKDANSNARLDEGELYKLSDFGIVSLSTVHDNLRSHAELKDGSSMMMEDLWFDPFERRRRLQAARDNGFDV